MNDEADLVHARRRISRVLRDEQRLIHLGLAAWVLRQYLRGSLPLERAQPLFQSLSAQLGSVAELWSLIDVAVTHDAGERLEWTNWVMFEEGSKGSAVWIDTNVYIWRLFVIAALRQLAGDKDVPQLPPTEAGKSASHSSEALLWRAVKDVADDAEGKFGPLVGPVKSDAYERLKKAISASAMAQEQRETDTVIQAALSQENVQQVTTNILEAWAADATLRHIANKEGACIWENAPPPQGLGLVGYYQFDRKDVYVKESGVWSGDWGDHYGRGLAQAENEIVIKEIMNVAPVDPTHSEPLGMEWPSELRAVLGEFRQRYRRPVILLVGLRTAAWRLSTVEGFGREQPNRRAHQLGRLDGVDVYTLHVDVPASALIVDFTQLGKWRQFSPKPVLATETAIATGIQFGVDAITPERAKVLVEKHPDLIETLGGGDQNVQGAFRELQLRVEFRLVEAFVFAIQNPAASLKIFIHEGNE